MKLSATLALVILVATAVAKPWKCFPGQYQYKSKNLKICTSCPLNTYSSGRTATSCKSCRPGTYTKNRGARRCTSCPAGKYNSRSGGSCRRCPANSYSSPGAKSCTKCPKGTRSSSGAQTCSIGLARVENNVAYWGANIRNFRSKGVQDCYNNCKKQKGCASFTMRKSNRWCWLKKKRNGANRTTGVTSRVSVNMVRTKLLKTCSSGQYSYNNGKSCRSCSLNTYSSGGKASSCKSCRPGTYSNRGARKCTSCPAGTYNSRSGGSCRRCPANSYSSPGAKSCTKCPKGTRSSSGAQTCSIGLARVENNVDYWGADIRNFRSKGVQDCYNNCRKQKGCASFAMRKTDSYCWLKKKRNGAKRTGNRDRLSANMVPVDGGWSDYGTWTNCSVKCGGKGTKQRSRSCNKPAPANGGKGCKGNDKETKTCNTKACPVDGGWSDYGTWTNCSVKCGGKGTKQRRRSCNKPAPANGGKGCKGDDKQTAVCNATKACPVYPKQTLTYSGYWGDWGRWSYCPNGGFATSFKQKVERNQGGGDDSALNGICLICSQGGTVCSTVGPWGSWRTSRTRLSGFNAFKMKYERKQGRRGDDSGANAVRLYANSYANSYYGYNTSNEGKWGKWSGSMKCMSGTVICGIRTRVERNQGRGDDTALNGVQFKCCS